MNLGPERTFLIQGTALALVILYLDASSGSVGFEGWGYFTVYLLIGSVSSKDELLQKEMASRHFNLENPSQFLRLIVTYAIMALQMN